MSSSSDTAQLGFWASVKEVIVLLLLVFLIRTFGFGLYLVPTGSMETTMLVGERFFADKLTPLFSDIKNGEVIAFNNPLFSYSKNKMVRLFQEYVWGPDNWTKRVIGMPGDRVKGAIEDGKPVIYLNEKRLIEPYVNKYPLVRVWKIDQKEVQEHITRGDIDSLWRYIEPKSFDQNRPYDDQPFYRIKKDRIYADVSGQIALHPEIPIYQSSETKRYSVGKSYWTESDEFDVILGKNKFWVMGDNRLGSKDSRWFGPLDGRLIHGRILYRIWSIDSNESWWIWDLIKNPVDFFKRVRWSRFFQKVR
ncbi:signal peptidase I [bacterium]|nr:signal peptidase I [bacterium]